VDVIDPHICFVEVPSPMPLSDFGAVPKPRKRAEVDVVRSHVSFDEIPSRIPQSNFTVAPKPRKRLTVSDLESDQEVVERIRDFLQNEPSDDDDECPKPSPTVLQSHIPAEDSIAVQLAAFRKRTESLLQNAGKSVPSMHNPIEEQD
jgi:hypothetical protein